MDEGTNGAGRGGEIKRRRLAEKILLRNSFLLPTPLRGRGQ